MKYKKAQINQIFVYLVSIIIILFVGFLVVKFVINFTKDTENSQNSRIYNDLKKDFKTVYTTYGAEKVLKYRLSSNVNKICFISELDAIKTGCGIPEKHLEDSKTLFSSGNNVILFGEETIISSQNIGDFTVKENNGCICFEPINNIFTLVMENSHNVVYVESDE